MNKHRDRLMTWQPGANGFSRDDTILAVGLQCRSKRFLLKDVLGWLGVPDKATGNSAGGQLVYFYSGENTEVVPMFDVSEGRVVAFSTVARFRDNAIRVHPETGKESFFNILDTMGPFDAAEFK